MSILLFSDLHLDQWRQFSSVNENGFSTRLLEQIRVIHKVCEIAVTENVSDIIFLGDLFNSQGESLPKVVYNAAFHCLQELSKVKPLYIIVGNHDMYRKMHILSSYQEIRNVTIVDRPMFINRGGYQIDLVPWEQQMKVKSRGDILLGHCEVVGTNMGNAISKVGYNPEEFEGYSRIYLGHFHTRQHFNVPKCQEAMYIGSVMQNNYSDTDENKGITILNTADTHSKLLPILSPRFLKSEVSSKTGIDSFTGMVNSTSDYYRLVVRNSKLEIPKFDHRVQVEWDVKESANARMEIKSEESIKDIVYRFVETHKTALDKDRIKETLNNIMTGEW